MDNDERVRAFLADLGEVTKRHGLTLDSCSCCNGIHVVEVDDDDNDLAGGIQWDGERYLPTDYGLPLPGWETAS